MLFNYLKHRTVCKTCYIENRRKTTVTLPPLIRIESVDNKNNDKRTSNIRQNPSSSESPRT